MVEQSSGDRTSSRRGQPRPLVIMSMIMLVLLSLLIITLYFATTQTPRLRIDYTLFCQQLAANNIKSVEYVGMELYGEFNNPPVDPDVRPPEAGQQPQLLKKNFVLTLPPSVVSDSRLNEEMFAKGVIIKARRPSIWQQFYRSWIKP